MSIDRTTVCKSFKSNRLTIQTVPKNIYNATYPCWIFAEHLLINLFVNYEERSSFNSTIENSIKINEKIIEFKGYILKSKT